MHAMKKKTDKMMFMGVKTDMSKAYDRLEWSFLEKVLRVNGSEDHF